MMQEPSFTQREWLRFYRTLGLPQDAPQELVKKASARLLRKYADNEDAQQTVNNAVLHISARNMKRSITEDAKKVKVEKMKSFSPERLIKKYVLGYIPPNIRQMIEMPTTSHVRWTGSILGAMALIAICVPQQAANFVGLAAACALGIIYQRGRPEPRKDDAGNVGEVQKVKPKEFVATIAVVLFGVLIGGFLTYLLNLIGVGMLPQVLFATATCGVFWVLTLFVKVYKCFD